MLLTAAHIASPYILVGHSLGGWNVRVYRDKYPREVAGVILVDAPHEDLRRRIPSIPRRQRPEILRHPVVLIAKALGQIGLLRLLAPDPGPAESGFSPSEWATLAALNWQPKSLAAEPNEKGAGDATADRIRSLRPLGNLPFTVMTAGLGMAEDDEAIKIQLNEELAGRSLRGKQVVVWNSGHGIPQQAPGAVVDEVRAMVDALREPQPVNALRITSPPAATPPSNCPQCSGSEADRRSASPPVR